MSDFEDRKRKKIAEIEDHTRTPEKTAHFSYKYDTLKFRMNVLQVLIMLFQP